jgi:hypothetical protein
MPTELGEFFSTPTGQSILECIQLGSNSLQRIASSHESLSQTCVSLSAQASADNAAHIVKTMEAHKLFELLVRTIIPFFNTLQQLLNLGLGTGVIPARMWVRVLGSFQGVPKIDKFAQMLKSGELNDIFDNLSMGSNAGSPWTSSLK